MIIKTSTTDIRLLVQSHIPEMNELTLDQKAGIMRSIEDLRFYSTTSDKDTKEITSIEIYRKEAREDRENALVVSLTCSIVESEVKILGAKREYAFEINLMVKRQTHDEYKEEYNVASPLSRDEVSEIIFGDVLPV